MFAVTFIILLPAALIALGALVLLNTAERSDIEGLLRLLRTARRALTAAYPLILLWLGLDYALGGWSTNGWSLALFAIVRVPLLLVFGYAVAALLANLLLHFVLRRYCWQGRTVDDARTARALRRAVTPFRWLHVAMSVGSRLRFARVLAGVRVAETPGVEQSGT